MPALIDMMWFISFIVLKVHIGIASHINDGNCEGKPYNCCDGFIWDFYEKKCRDKLRTEKPFSTKKVLFSTDGKNIAIEESIPNVAKPEDNYMQKKSIAVADEERTAPIQYAIICLSGVSGVLLMMYIASHAVKRHRRPGNAIDIEKRENFVNSAKENKERFQP